MKERRQTEDINASENVIRRPLYWVIFLLPMFLISLLLCFWDTLATGFFAEVFYIITGFSIWIPVTIITFLLFAMNCYIYFRFKLVIHEQSFFVTPLFGLTHEVAFSSVKKITNSKRISRTGFYIEIEYDNRTIRIPYTIKDKGSHFEIEYDNKRKDILFIPNIVGTIRQKSVEVLLKKFDDYKTNVLIEE